MPIIISYGRLRTGLPIPKGFPEIMIDSGGYQSHMGTATRDIYLEAYALWLKLTLPSHSEIKTYFNMDITRDPEDSLTNQKY